MKETHYTLSDTQRKFLTKLYDMLNGYYVKGNNSYTTLTGYTLGMRDSMSLIDTILYTQRYTPSYKRQLNEIRSMYISLNGLW
jgi:hypothetical protein